MVLYYVLMELRRRMGPTYRRFVLHFGSLRSSASNNSDYVCQVAGSAQRTVRTPHNWRRPLQLRDRLLAVVAAGAWPFFKPSGRGALGASCRDDT